MIDNFPSPLAIGQFRNLRRLHLCGTDLSEERLAWTQADFSWPHLDSLTLEGVGVVGPTYNNTFPPFTIFSPTTLPFLRHLKVTYNRQSAGECDLEGLALLTPQLLSLHLTDISPSNVLHFFQLTSATLELTLEYFYTLDLPSLLPESMTVRSVKILDETRLPLVTPVFEGHLRVLRDIVDKVTKIEGVASFSMIIRGIVSGNGDFAKNIFWDNFKVLTRKRCAEYRIDIKPVNEEDVCVDELAYTG